MQRIDEQMVPGGATVGRAGADRSQAIARREREACAAELETLAGCLPDMAVELRAAAASLRGGKTAYEREGA